MILHKFCLGVESYISYILQACFLYFYTGNISYWNIIISIIQFNWTRSCFLNFDRSSMHLLRHLKQHFLLRVHLTHFYLELYQEYCFLVFHQWGLLHLGSFCTKRNKSYIIYQRNFTISKIHIPSLMYSITYGEMADLTINGIYNLYMEH